MGNRTEMESETKGREETKAGGIKEIRATKFDETETNEAKDKRVCPLCGETYSDAPALSRNDNRTLICQRCGTRESLIAVGVSSEEQEKILAAIYGNAWVKAEGWP